MRSHTRRLLTASSLRALAIDSDTKLLLNISGRDLDIQSTVSEFVLDIDDILIT